MRSKEWKQTKGSYILRFFTLLTRFVYAALGVGLLGRIFTSYSAVERKFRASCTGHVVHARERRNGKMYRALRRNVALAMDQSLISRGSASLIRRICSCGLRTVGLFFVTTGTYSAVMYWLFSVIWKSNVVGIWNLLCGLVLLLLGFLLLLSEQSLGYALQKSMFFKRILVGVLGVSEDALKDVEKTGKQSYVLAVPLGMVVGALGALVTPFYLITACAVLLLFTLVLSVPEAGVILMILFLPFADLLPQSELWMMLLMGVPIASYLLKLMRGNRAVHVEVQDLPAVLMAVLFVLSGVSVAGQSAWRGALLSALCVAFGFMAVNVIATPQWLDRCRAGMIVSATCAALLGIFQFVFAAVSAAEFSFSALGAFVHAGFADRTTLAYCLAVSLPFILGAFLSFKKKYRLLVGFALVSVLASLALTWVQSAWIAAAVMIVAFLLLHERRIFPFALVGGALLPFVLWLMPHTVRARLLDLLRADSSAVLAMNANAGHVAAQIFFERGNGVFGFVAGLMRLFFGLGHGGIEQFYMLYTVTDPTVLSGAMNFWLYRLLEGGVLGVLLPAAFLFLMCQNCFSLLTSTKSREAQISAMTGIVLVVGVLILSVFRYAWYDPAALLAFFLAAAIICATARHERGCVPHEDEEEKDENVIEMEYYGKG
jgi:hypothetical protein